MGAVLRDPQTGALRAGSPMEELDGSAELVAADSLPLYTQISLHHRVSLVVADMDFETYSEAGYHWNGEKWERLPGATQYGLPAVSAVAYSEHPSTEVLSLYYNLKDGHGPRLWLPCMPPPQALFDYLAAGGIIEAWNSQFEWWIWTNVCARRYGWPPLPFLQLRDAAAKSRAYAYPGRLADAAAAIQAQVQKQTEGKRLIKLLSCPRQPTRKDKRTRVLMADVPEDAAKMLDYNRDDIRSEAAVSALLPELPPQELLFWQCTQAMNTRGMQCDLKAAADAQSILEQCYTRYNAQLAELTGNVVTAGSQGERLKGWLESRGLTLPDMQADTLEATLKRDDLSPDVRKALELRDRVASAGVKKVYAMQRSASSKGRLHDLYIYNQARTGRDGGADVQPQNLVKAGPAVRECSACGRYAGPHLPNCPYCGALQPPVGRKWTWQATDDVIAALATRDLDHVERLFGDGQLAVSGVIRGLFVAAPGHDLICSDFSSIEAVVTAELAGEQWRIDAFHRKEDIYLHSCCGITGRTMDEYNRYLAEHGDKHPDRQYIGKPAELGLGFGGWINAWRQFDDSDRFSDDEVKEFIKAWRAKSPAIVEMWGGQSRGMPWDTHAPTEYYGFEGCFIQAALNPGAPYSFRQITFTRRGKSVFVTLPSGRELVYHDVELVPRANRWGRSELAITFWGYNTNPTNGARGWICMSTYGGRLTENIVQAVARDILAHAVIELERAGYPVVLRVHDEIASEVPEGFGSVERFEQIMGSTPAWCSGWPVRASGGWRGKRYRKD